ncbi:MAG TPA: amino acid racemase [Firmicutes bacterium]|nr:amino acid racemase [Candidatus Fermentithermobacillaceae bacterium]
MTTGNKTRKTVGILGGMGPEATADLFMKIIKATPAKKDQEHLRIVIDNNPSIPDRTAYILGKGEDPTPFLIETAKNLEKMGAGLIAMPCNTAHFFHRAIQEAVGVPVLHMMKEVAQVLRGKVERVGLLATTGTIKTGLYETHLGDAGISVIVPSPADQEEVMEAIYAVKGGDLERGREIALRQGAKLAAEGAQAVIAGCTELPLILHDGDLDVPVVDPTRVLAEACVRIALGE